MDIPFRPLGIVKEIIQEIGLEVTYAYDDLVFVEHNAFLLRFGEEGPLVDLFFNRDCPGDEADSILASLTQAAAVREMTLTRRGTYVLNANDDNTMALEFLEH